MLQSFAQYIVQKSHAASFLSKYQLYRYFMLPSNPQKYSLVQNRIFFLYSLVLDPNPHPVDL